MSQALRRWVRWMAWYARHALLPRRVPWVEFTTWVLACAAPLAWAAGDSSPAKDASREVQVLMQGPLTAPRPQVTRQRFLLEADGHALNLAQAREASGWKDHSGLLALGFGREAFWIHVALQGLVPGAPLVIRVRPAFLDDVALHLPDGQGGFRVLPLGDRQPIPPEGTPDGALAIDWTPAAGQTRADLYLRVSTTSTRTAQLMVLPLNEAEWRRGRENALAGLFFGVMLCLLGWGSLSAIVRRDAVLGFYCAYQLVGSAMSAGLMGYARLLLPPDAPVGPDGWTSVSVLGITAVAAAFHLAFLRSVMGAGGQLPLSLQLVLWACIGGSGLNLVLYAAGWQHLALAINAKLVTLASMLLAVVVVVEAVRRRDSPLRPILMAYSVQCILVVLTLLPLLGLVQIEGWMQYGTSFHTLMVAVVLAVMLLMRRVETEREADRMREGLRTEQIRAQRALEERDERDRFLSMLTHELRTPLSVIRMVLDGSRRREATPAVHRQLDLARAAVLDIDQVIERTVQVDRLERQALDSRQLDCDVAEIVGLCVAAAGSPHAERLAYAQPSHPVIVRSDPVLLRSIVGNLLDNALKYAAPASIIEVSVVGDPPGCPSGPRLRVANRPGRAGRPDAARVFQKYYRSEGAQHSTGSGQGLYLVHGLARHLGLRLVCDPGRDGDPDSPVVFELRWDSP